VLRRHQAILQQVTGNMDFSHGDLKASFQLYVIILSGFQKNMFGAKSDGMNADP
jgi:hypothetical protein